ncbi:MAG: Uma2 family endonuclease [Snowella sp.]|nr:Uma2 family endonuclease [Snowella sp.]
MIALKSDNCMTPEEYLRFERHSDIKHEYIDGEVYAMAGTTKVHNTISLNLAILFREKLKHSNCQTFIADIKVNILNENSFFYPDIVVTCDNNNDFNAYEIQFPKIIVEVFSLSTEKLDRGKKFQYYRTIPSLQEYILVSSQEYLIECFRRTQDNLWTLQIYEDLDQIIRIESLNIDISLSDIYATLNFESVTESQSDSKDE